jgi:hypothetical protein
MGWEMYNFIEETDAGHTAGQGVRNAAAPLAPGLLRVGGITADWVYYDLNTTSATHRQVQKADGQAKYVARIAPGGHTKKLQYLTPNPPPLSCKLMRLHFTFPWRQPPQLLAKRGEQPHHGLCPPAAVARQRHGPAAGL